MKNLIKSIYLGILLINCLVISGCFMRHIPDVQQGNIFDKKAVQQLRIGMPKDVVQSLLGTPMLDSVFEDDCWTYVYTKQINGGKIKEKEINLYFVNDKLARIK